MNFTSLFCALFLENSGLRGDSELAGEDRCATFHCGECAIGMAMPQNTNTLGPIIATRQLALDGKKTITLRVGQPFIPPDWNNNFCCCYQIVGLGDEKVRYAGGVDSLQALQLALMRAATDLYISKESKTGRLTWEGEGDLGLPVADVIADLVPKRKT